MSEPVRIVIFKDEDQWVAQCLEHDVCTQASDIDTLHDRMRLTLQAEHELCVESGKDGLDCLPKAPSHFFDMWDHRQKTFDQTGRTENLSYELALVA